MSTEHEAADVVIVGARCAGSALAYFLARAGARVIVLERDALKSDHVLSTHTLHPAGVRVVDEMGLGPELRRAAPAMLTVLLEKEDAKVLLPLSPSQAEYCPRRQRFDGLLQDKAIASGADLRQRCRVTELLWDDHRVVGVRYGDQQGAQRTIRSPLVIGADGRQSTVAAFTGAEEYFGYDAPRAMYWGYFPAPSGYEPRMDIAFRGGDIRVAFATEADQVLVGVLPPAEQARKFGADPLRMLREVASRQEPFASLVAKEPACRVRGIVRTRYFFRRAIGPGWALAGDAGLHKEFVSGDGMSEALWQAKRLANAVQRGTQAALHRYWHERDAAAIPRFFFYKDQGATGPRGAFEVFALKQLAKDPRLVQRLGETFEHKLSPYEVISPRRALQWLAKAWLSGHFGMSHGFMKMGRQARGVHRLVQEAENRAWSDRSLPASFSPATSYEQCLATLGIVHGGS